MAFLAWKNEFSVGNDEIDSQHQALIAMINKMHDALKLGKGSAEAAVTVKEMINYSRFHFDTEEKLMRRIQYPRIDEHINEHKAFIAKAHGFEEQIAAGTFSLSIDLANFLRDWLSNHILVNDKAYSSLITKK